MAQKCSCGGPAHGSVGMVVMCRYCVSAMCGLGQSKFRKPMTLEIRREDGTKFNADWMPWSFTKPARHTGKG
jgi:hypothetical protein